jgi:hypothetical protein
MHYRIACSNVVTYANLQSKACRNSITFGMPLTKGECVTLMQKLGQCDMPFNCAREYLMALKLLYHIRFFSYDEKHDFDTIQRLMLYFVIHFVTTDGRPTIVPIVDLTQDNLNIRSSTQPLKRYKSIKDLNIGFIR